MEPFERPLGFNFGTRFGEVGTQIDEFGKPIKNNEKKHTELLDGDDEGETEDEKDSKDKAKQFNNPSASSSGGLTETTLPTYPTIYPGGAGPYLKDLEKEDKYMKDRIDREKNPTGELEDPFPKDDPRNYERLPMGRRGRIGGAGQTSSDSSGEPKKSTKITDLGKEGGYVPLPPGVDRYADRLPPLWEKCTVPNPTTGAGGPATIEVDCCKQEQKEKIQELFASIINDPLIRERGQRFLWCITSSNQWTRTDGETRKAWAELWIECVDEKLPDSYNGKLDADQNRKLKLSLDQIKSMNKYDLLKILLAICSSLTSSGKSIYLDYIILTSRNITPELLTKLLLEAKPNAKNGDRLLSDYFIWDSATGIVYVRDYNGAPKYPLLKNLSWKK